jgi:hypothetical protein
MTATFAPSLKACAGAALRMSRREGWAQDSDLELK